jgi:signal transduction histidine kinase
MNILLLLLLFQPPQSTSAASRIDSLKQELIKLSHRAAYVSDSLQHLTLKELMKIYSDQDIDSSSHYNELLIKLCHNPHLQKELSYAYQYAGYLHQVRGDYHQSIRYYYKALATAEKLDQFKQMAASYRGLGHAYSSLKEYEKAANQCRLGLEALRKEPDAYTQLGILNVQGAIFREQQKLDDALKANNAMYLLAKQQNEPWYESQGLHALGWVYKEKGDYPKALDFYMKALLISRKIGSVDLECSILLNISDIYSQQKLWSYALQYCIQAKQRAGQIKNSSIVAESEGKLYEIFKSKGEYKNSLKAYEQFVFLRDSLSKEKTDHRIENLQALYDNVRKTNALQKREVELLNEQNKGNALSIGICSILVVAALLFWNNRKLQAKNSHIKIQHNLLEEARAELANMNTTLGIRVAMRTEELSSANKELLRKNEEIKEALFKGQKIERKRVALELHDNLSSLLSAVNMSIQSINPKNLSELEQTVYQNVKQMIQGAYAEVRNISHNILPPELEQDGLVSTLSNLMRKMNQTSGLQLSLAIDDLNERLPVEIEFNLYSIILELMNNTIRHAAAKSLMICIWRTHYGIEITVTDDGRGLTVDEGKRGTGLQNIHTRLESLGGTFDILAPQKEGTSILIKIPIETVRINGNVTV